MHTDARGDHDVRRPVPGLELTVIELTEAAVRADRLIELRRRGRSWFEIVSSEDAPLVVEAISRVLDELGELGGRFRREEALALQREGVNITRIGRLFRVSGQRASALLKVLPGRVENDH